MSAEDEWIDELQRALDQADSGGGDSPISEADNPWAGMLDEEDDVEAVGVEEDDVEV